MEICLNATCAEVLAAVSLCSMVLGVITLKIKDSLFGGHGHGHAHSDEHGLGHDEVAHDETWPALLLKFKEKIFGDLRPRFSVRSLVFLGMHRMLLESRGRRYPSAWVANPFRDFHHEPGLQTQPDEQWKSHEIVENLRTYVSSSMSCL